MQFKKLALIFMTVTLLVSCVLSILSVRSENIDANRSENIANKTSPPVIPPPLKTAIEELRVIKIKIEGDIHPKEYSEDIRDLTPIVENAYGDAEILATVKSALAGHQLAVQFWECDRVSGYDELFQCRDQVLQAVFQKYPDIAAQAQAIIASENTAYISAELDENSVLEAIWQKTGTDTEMALQMSNPTSLTADSHTQN
ncbi:MAG: hypothetical protein RIE73_23425 [Coleofasciculus sp. C1-SOL-03]|jgi:hypothetical protein|uniref:hypothetical protein n=1 Tax=Coleofasciculus sp. C1-SOL-03 TaxID=3069522 RepID=UPI0032F45AF0